MIIATISPRYKQTLTTTTLLIAQALSHATKLDVTLTYTGRDYQSLAEYTGLSLTEDKTRSTTQLIKLISTGALQAHELREYAIKLGHNLHLLNTASDTSTDKNSEELLRYVMDSTQDIGSLLVIEINTDLNTEITQEILKKADLIILIGDQTKATANQYKVWFDYPDLLPERSKTCLVITNFDGKIMNARDVAKMYGVQYKRTSRISYNPYVVKFANDGNLTELFPYILDCHHNVFPLRADLRDITKLIGNNIGFPTEWRD